MVAALKAVAQEISEHPGARAYRSGWGELVVSVPAVAGGGPGATRRTDPTEGVRRLAEAALGAAGLAGVPVWAAAFHPAPDVPSRRGSWGAERCPPGGGPSALSAAL
jgi:hypothetical protein